MVDIKMIFTIIALVITAIVALSVVLKTRKGMKRGAYLQPLSLLTVILSAVIAFIGMTVASGAVFGYFEGKTMQDLIDAAASSLGISIDAEISKILLSFDAEAISYILAIPVAILAPIVFILLYTVVKILLSIILKIISAAVKIPKRIDLTGKVIGGVLGALEGLLAMVIVFIPLTSILHLGTTVMSGLDTGDSVLTEVVEGVEELNGSPVMSLINLAGGDFLSTELSTVNLSNTRINISNEISYVIDLIGDLALFAENSGGSSDGDIGALLTPENEKILDSILETLGKSEYMPILLSGGMHLISNVFFPELPDNPENPEDKLMAALRDLLGDSDKTTVIADLGTMKNLIFFLQGEGVLDILTSDDEEAVKNILTKKDEDGNTVIKSAVNILKSNPRTVNIIAVLNELSISIMCENLGTGANSAETYESIKGGLNELITIDHTSPEYKDNVKNTLSTTLTENGIELEAEIVDTMTDYVTDYLDDARENGTLPDEIGDEEVTDIILTYYDAYLEYMGSQEN